VNKIFIVLIFLFSLSFVCFSYASNNDSENKISNLIKNYVLERNSSVKPDNLQIAFKREDKQFDQLNRMEGSLEYKIQPDFTNKRLAGNIVVPVDIIQSGKFVKTINFNTIISIYRNVVVSSKFIMKNQVVSDDDISVEKRDVTYIPDNIIIEKNMVLFNQATTAIPKNSIFLLTMIKKVPMIKRGSLIKIVGVVNSVKIDTSGVALQDGNLNDIIKVKNSDFKKVIDAVVLSSSEVKARIY